jgi:hypothetical protein
MIVPLVVPGSPSSAIAITREGAVADRALSACIGNDLTLRGKPFSWLVLELDAAFPEGLRPHPDLDADFPSRYALSTARSLLSDVDRIFGLTASFSDLDSFEGDLLIHWRSGNAGIALICPSDSTRVAKVYRERVENDAAVESVLIENPRPSDIVGLIKWIKNPA